MRRRHALWTATGLAASAAIIAGTQAPSALAATPRSAGPGTSLAIYQIPAGKAGIAALLSRGFDVLENTRPGTAYVLGDAATEASLRSAGYSPSVSEKLAPTHWKAPTSRLTASEAAKPLADPADETFDNGYHTVKAQYAHLDKVAATFPGLARVADYGDSYLKTKNPSTGYDLKAICITKKTADADCTLVTGAPKPRFVLMTQMHARELVSGDIAWRFIDYLTQNYGKAAAVTNLLDTTEVWVVPVVNPDGVDVVQQGGNHPYLQRKNVSGTGCSLPPGAGGQRGVDLNRNTSWHWGTTGVDFSKCSEIYPGASGNSEAETSSLQTMFKQLWPDQRGPNDTDAAPATARGTMLSIHTYAGVILYPWGWNDNNTANEASLKRIAGQMSALNGYPAGQPGEVLYNASGNIEDWTYGELGVASFTIEARSCNSFTPAYSCTTGEFNTNLPALMYLAGQAKAPYKP
jgi:carboxypeptidase T